MIRLWSNPVFFVFLGLLPLLLLIYIFRRQARKFFTSALFLWRENAVDAGSSARFRPALPPLHFFLEGAALILLVCAGAEPLAVRKEQFPPAAVILNNAYSMTPRVRKKALKMLKRRLTDFPGRRVMWLLGGENAEIIADAGEKTPDLERLWDASEPEFQVGKAIARARMYCPRGEIILVTDRPPPRPIPGVTLLSAGTPGENLALVNVRCGEGRLLLEVRNFSSRPASSEVTAGTLLRHKFTIGGNERKTFNLPIPGFAGTLEILLKTPGDPLPFDDRAFVVVRPPAPIRFAYGAMTPETERALEMVLRGNPEFSRVTEGAEVIFTTAGPFSSSRSMVCFHQGRRAVADEHPPSLNKDSELAEGLDTTALRWAGFAEAALPGRGVLFSSSAPLLSLETRAGNSCRIHFNISFPHSNVTDRPFWPAFFCNAAAYLRALRPGPAGTVFRAAEPFRVRSAGEGDHLSLSGPDGQRRFLLPAGGIMLKLKKPGFYTLEGSTGKWQLGVNPRVTAVSDLRNCRSEIKIADLREFAPGENFRSRSWLFIIGALLLLALNQYIASRGRP